MNIHWPLSAGVLGDDWQWPHDRRVLLLLDGVSVSGLPRKLYEWSKGELDADLLYAGTPWATVKDVSPWLIRLSGPDDPVLKRFVRDGAEAEWGYLMISDAPMLEVAGHLRSLIQVRHPLGMPMLLRLADPAVISVLMGEKRSLGLAPWGPIEQLMVPDGVAGQWRVRSPGQRESSASACRTDVSEYQVDENLLHELQACDLRRDIRQLAGFVEQHCRGWLDELNTETRHRHLKDVAQHAQALGLNSRREWALLCTLLARLDIASPEGLPENIHRLLDTEGIDGMQRLESALASTKEARNNLTGSLS